MNQQPIAKARKENPWKDPQERIESYKDFHEPLKEQERRAQAGRCLHCGVPFCQSAIEINRMVTGCPLHNLIPEWNEQLWLGHDEKAFERLYMTNPFADFTSRVCPALCEKACIHSIDEEATTIHDNERFIMDQAWDNGWMKPNIPRVRTGKSVAIIGSGPAGLSAAYWLNQRGHGITVFERDDAPGGLLRYGIPNMKLEKEVLDRRIKLLEDEGIEFLCETDPIKNPELLEGYDAVLIACGAKKARDIQLKNRDLDGIHFAVDYLKESTKALHDDRDPQINAKGKHVVVLGGGDTGNDCMGTAMRQQAKSLVQLEMMPKKPDQRPVSNPWPEWPIQDKVDYGVQEALVYEGHDPRIFETTITRLIGKDGKLRQIEIAKLDQNRNPIPSSKQIIDCDLLLIAAGFLGAEDEIFENLDVEKTVRSTIEADQEFKAGNNLYACGDARKGQSLVVWALKDGKDAARAIDKSLMGYSQLD